MTKHHHLLPFICTILLLTSCAGLHRLDAAYYDRFDTALSAMAEIRYDEAETALISLASDLAEPALESEEARELQADTEFALGTLYTRLGDYQKAYDSYNSAFIYYRDLLGADAGKTLDTRLHMASLEEDALARDEHARSEYTDISSTCEDPLYRDIAMLLEGYALLDLDDGADAATCLVAANEIIAELPEDESELRAFAASWSGEKTSGEKAPGKKSSAEDSAAERDRLLGRTTALDRYYYAYDFISSYYIAADEPDSAEESLQAALRLLDTCEIEAPEHKVSLYTSLAFISIYYRGADSGNEYLTQAIETARKIYPAGIALSRIYINAAEASLAGNDYDSFQAHLATASEMIESTAGYNHSENALAMLLQSEYFTLTGQMKEAILCCEESIEIRKNILDEDAAALGSYYNRLANTYAEADQDSMATETYRKAMEILREKDEVLELAVTERNLALHLRGLYGWHREAIDYAMDAISLVEDMDMKYYGSTIAAIYMVMADIAEPGDPEYYRVEEFSEKARERLLTAVGNCDEEMGNYHYNLGNYLLDNERYPEAMPHLKAAIDHFINAYGKLAYYPVDPFNPTGRCAYKMRNYDEALSYFESSVNYNKAHINLMHKNGNYNDRYWFNTQADSQVMVDQIRLFQREPTRNPFGGYFYNGTDGLDIFKKNKDNTVELYFYGKNLYMLGTNTGLLDGNTISFECVIEDSSNPVTGKIEILEDRAVVTIVSMAEVAAEETAQEQQETAEYENEERVYELDFISDESKIQKKSDAFFNFVGSEWWTLDRAYDGLRPTKLRFGRNGIVEIRHDEGEEEDDYVVEAKESFRFVSKDRVMIGNDMFRILFAEDYIMLDPVHDNGMGLGGYYAVE